MTVRFGTEGHLGQILIVNDLGTICLGLNLIVQLGLNEGGRGLSPVKELYSSVLWEILIESNTFVVEIAEE